MKSCRAVVKTRHRMVESIKFQLIRLKDLVYVECAEVTAGARVGETEADVSHIAIAVGFSLLMCLRTQWVFCLLMRRRQRSVLPAVDVGER